MSASSSDTGRQSRNYMNTRGRSSSPNRFRQTVTTKEVVDSTQPNAITTTTTTTTHTSNVIPVQRNSDNEEPIRLSKFSGGYAPDPQTPHKIEGLDWPAPPYPAAVPELRARSRSSSNRRAPSTVVSVHGEEDEDTSDDDNDEEVKRVLIDGVETHLTVSGSTAGSVSGGVGASSVSSSAVARAKASRPNSKLRYQNKLFDNDYDDYLLRYKSDKEWRKIMHQSMREGRYQSGESGANGGINEYEQDNIADDDDENRSDSPPPPINAKLQREIDEISKIENESSMAAVLLNDLKAHQKVISRKLKIDPWKASRTPSANIEPSVRTRFESPVNACKCLIF